MDEAHIKHPSDSQFKQAQSLLFAPNGLKNCASFGFPTTINGFRLCNGPAVGGDAPYQEAEPNICHVFYLHSHEKGGYYSPEVMFSSVIVGDTQCFDDGIRALSSNTN